jgi:hypothetical protein
MTGIKRNTAFSPLYFFLLVFIIFTGCAVPPNIQVDVLEPAKIALPSTVNRIGILNQSWYDKPDTTLLEQSGDLQFQPIELSNNDISKNCISGFHDALSNSPRFEYQELGEINLETNDNSKFLTDSEWGELQKLCTDSLFDALALLKYVDYYDFIGQNITEDGEEYKYYSLFLKVAWRIYDPFSQRIIDDFVSTDTTFVAISEGSDFLSILFAVQPDRETEITAASYWAGRYYGSRIAPQWTEVDRKYYVWKGEASALANQYILSNKWDEAAAIWNNATSSSKRNLASKACFNMALASEVMDNYDMALYWAKKSQELKYRTGTEEYIKILEKRIQDKKQLDKQME